MAKTPKKSPTPSGFEEAPQASFEGVPARELSGSVSDWVKQLEAEAEAASVETQRELASKAGKHRKKIEIEARKQSEKVAMAKSSRGTSMGVSSDPKTRAAAGLNPVAGMDVSLEEAGNLAPGAVTATVEALSSLIESGNPLFKDGKIWTPHRPARPQKSEGGIAIRMQSDYQPAGDQPTAIKDLVEGLANDDRTQVLLGVTGSGKTFTMAKVIEATQRPAVILAPNKTLAAQLYSEFKNFFPDNAVEYFVSYYDYYQPEAYVPRSDTFIEKESSINEQIDRMRHAATRAILERDDCIIIASVSCIYGIGSVETYTAMTFQMNVGDRLDQRQLLADLVAQQYKRQDINFVRGSFRVRGDTIEIFPAHLEDAAWRISMFGDEIDAITEFDPLTGKKTGEMKSVKIYANSHYVTPRPTLNGAIKSIKEELKVRLAELEKGGRLLEAQRLEQRTRYDIEMMEATGASAGIGLAIARELLGFGADLLIVGRDADALEMARDELADAYPDREIHGLAADVADDEDRREILDWVEDHSDGLHILVNNAGGNISKPATEYTEDEWRGIFETNLFSAFELSRYAHPLLARHAASAIVNVGSVSGLTHVRSGA
ncbi:MAG: SDR family NAD(P)-dependent oxidoreductase, partial [Arenimonas sp.]|nr:SDR family NAD(P)-dependent oxidoreductase [Arenimonas sp.]